MVIIAIVRAITKAMFTETKDSLRWSARVFFLSSSLLCWTCLFAQRRVIVPHPIFNDTSVASDQLPLLSPVTSEDDDTRSSPWHRTSGSLWRRTAKKMRCACLHMFLCFFVLATIYPGVPSDVHVRDDVTSDDLLAFPVLRVTPWAVGLGLCWSTSWLSSTLWPNCCPSRVSSPIPQA